MTTMELTVKELEDLRGELLRIESEYPQLDLSEIRGRIDMAQGILAGEKTVKEIADEIVKLQNEAVVNQRIHQLNQLLGRRE